MQIAEMASTFCGRYDVPLLSPDAAMKGRRNNLQRASGRGHAASTASVSALARSSRRPADATSGAPRPDALARPSARRWLPQTGLRRCSPRKICHLENDPVCVSRSAFFARRREDRNEDRPHVRHCRPQWGWASASAPLPSPNNSACDVDTKDHCDGPPRGRGPRARARFLVLGSAARCD